MKVDDFSKDYYMDKVIDKKCCYFTFPKVVALEISIKIILSIEEKA
jgi:hypothetical protein